jgi:SAM-dependent methyltransferase
MAVEKRVAMPIDNDGYRQKAHFESMHNAYEAHYYDLASMAYREEFIFGPMLKGLDLNGKTVAELASGSGHNSLYLKQKFPQIGLTGFDISERACEDYRQMVGAPCHVVDLTKPAPATEPFDVVFVIGGLHHCVADLDTTLTNVANMVKPGGLFLMLEPNDRHFLEFVRILWYRIDSSFDHQTEHAINHEALAASVDSKFRVESVQYFGGPGYFIILNSMILRIPISIKPHIAPFMTHVERLWNRLPGARWHNVFLARWQRR